MKLRMDPWQVISCDNTSNLGFGIEEKEEEESVKDQISNNTSGDDSLKASGSEIPVHLNQEPVPLHNNNTTALPADQLQSVSLAPGPKTSSSSELNSFEDSFQPPPHSFAKLPDSEEYLASLEKRLQSLQHGGKNARNSSAGGIIRSLGETRESYMVQLLQDSLPTSLQEDNFDDLKVNPILKKLAPEKQAIALEELVHLVKADQLSLILDESQQQQQQEEQKEKQEESSSTTTTTTENQDGEKVNSNSSSNQSGSVD